MYEVGYRVENQGFGNMISCGNSDVMIVCLSHAHTHTHTREHCVCKSAFLLHSVNVINIAVGVRRAANCIVFGFFRTSLQWLRNRVCQHNRSGKISLQFLSKNLKKKRNIILRLVTTQVLSDQVLPVLKVNVTDFLKNG